MRIVIHDYAGHAFPTSLSRALAARGHEVVHTFASSLQTPRGELSKRPTDPESLEFREIAMDADYPRYKYSFIRRRRMEIDYGHAVARFLNEWKPDAVLSGNTPTEAQEPISRAAIAHGGRFYPWVQDFYSLAVDKLVRKKIPIAGRFIGAWYRHLDRRQFARGSKIVTITEDFGPILTSEFSVGLDRIRVVPNWAEIEQLPCLPKDNEWARNHDLHDKFVFLYSGTIGMKHNPMLLLELARRYARDPMVKIVVVSEGIGADWLRKEAIRAGLTNLMLLPYQPFAVLPQVLATGDVLVGILEKEAGTFSVPSKTLSYLCAGRPLLLAIPPENLAARITREQGAGLIVAPDDIPGFLDAAAKFHASTNLRQETATRARAYAEAHFPIARTSELFEQLLSS
ncbi:MAG: glycosyltransferase family 4 protein [Luteolibacter sp.]